MTWSENSEQVLGVAHGRIARDGNLFMRHVHEDDRYQLLNDLEAALEGNCEFRATYRWIRPDRNELRWLHCRASLSAPSTETPLFEGVILDISDELAGPLKYFSGSESLHNVLSALPGLVVMLDDELRITRLNFPATEKDFSFGDLAFSRHAFRVGQSFLGCFGDPQLIAQIQKVARALLTGERSKDTFRVHESGKNYKVDFYVQDDAHGIEHASGLVCLVTDVSDLVELERRVAGLQRMESLRLLSMGIGHHFNNALQTIIGQASVINSHAHNLDLVLSASDSIVNTALKTSELSRQLFTHVDKDSQSPGTIDPNLALTEAANSAENLFQSGFAVSVVLGQLPLIRANYELLREVFVSVLEAARDSMRENIVGKKQLGIKTFTVELAESEIPALSAGRYAKIVFTAGSRNNSFQQLSRNLEVAAAFKMGQRKSASKGAQLHQELSEAINTITSLKGAIRAESAQPFGSSISIYLPSWAEDAEAQSIQSARPATRDVQTATPRILLVDDDRIVSFSVKAMLHELGEECLTAHNYSVALSTMKKSLDSVELILLDAILQTGDSALLCKRLKRLKPSVEIVGFSGASPKQTQALLDAGASEILRKPVPLQQLRSVLDLYLHRKKHPIAI